MTTHPVISRTSLVLAIALTTFIAAAMSSASELFGAPNATAFAQTDGSDEFDPEGGDPEGGEDGDGFDAEGFEEDGEEGTDDEDDPFGQLEEALDPSQLDPGDEGDGTEDDDGDTQDGFEDEAGADALEDDGDEVPAGGVDAGFGGTAAGSSSQTGVTAAAAALLATALGAWVAAARRTPLTASR